MCQAINGSAMNKCNVFAILQVGVEESRKDAVANKDYTKFGSYTEV